MPIAARIIFSITDSRSDNLDNALIQTPSITITSPIGGEEWYLGSPHVISWTYSDLSGNVKIDLLRGTSEIPFLSLTSSIDISISSYIWVYPSVLPSGSDYRIKISSTSDPSVYDISPFFIIEFPTSNNDQTGTLPVTGLIGNYPNPFNPDTSIIYSLSKSDAVSIDIYNIQGCLVKRLQVISQKDPGDHSTFWNGTDEAGVPVASGTYIIKMRAGKHQFQKKITLLK